jgi:hypothetical protein
MGLNTIDDSEKGIEKYLLRNPIDNQVENRLKLRRKTAKNRGFSVSLSTVFN